VNFLRSDHRPRRGEPPRQIRDSQSDGFRSQIDAGDGLSGLGLLEQLFDGDGRHFLLSAFAPRRQPR
jgi:predicted porin